MWFMARMGERAGEIGKVARMAPFRRIRGWKFFK
jgi:hypothetical protein